MRFVLLTALALVGVLAEPQSKDYLPPKPGGGGARRPGGQDDGPHVSIPFFLNFNSY